MLDKIDEINTLLMGAAGRMIVLAMSGNPEIKEAHQMVLDASILVDGIADELLAKDGANG